ncbi:MAG: acyltransferase [Ruminococcus sp.]|uniref:acyltransferase family protein n=1 Tax=Ruminococcus sp. TaxID=41978 RepID=UPI0025DDF8A4|nr:acyltransferase family protein [Ruminococcus sp.]MCR5600616.1 acyltransferase [Ruminococcus sp.]
MSKMLAGGGEAASSKRASNIELFRIITMLLIVAHHYVVNSGLTAVDGPIAESPTSPLSIFLLLFGAWGKIGINCFVMITGYFMCKSNITAKKFAKLLCEIMLYRIVLFLIFLLTEYENFSVTAFVKTIVPITSIKYKFDDCYMVFFLFIPFLNYLIKHISERTHFFLILLSCLTYVLFGTLKCGLFALNMNYVSWFMVLYVIASYIRLYPKKWFDNTKICGILLLLFVLMSAASVICCAYLGERFNIFIPFYFVTDSNSFLAVAVGVLAFLFFKNLRIPYNRFINTVAASTFGVLLIHANSDTMRRWLWNDTLDVVGHFGDELMPLYAIGCMIGIFTICSVIDIIRINLLEKPFFKLWDKYWNGVSSWITRKEKAFLDKMSIM